MSNEKILILEGPWEKNIADTRSTALIYRSIDNSLSQDQDPVRIIHKSLYASKFEEYIQEFTQLESNHKGINIIILSGHGMKRNIKQNGLTKHRRIINIPAAASCGVFE